MPRECSSPDILPFPMDVRNMLVNSGRVSAHHFLPQSGWVSYWIKGEQDLPDVIDLFKMRYDFLKQIQSK